MRPASHGLDRRPPRGGDEATGTVVVLRIGTTVLELVIIGLFLLMALHIVRANRDFVRARLSLNVDKVLQAVLALLAGFSIVISVSISFVVGMPLTGVSELAVIYAWLLATLFGTVQLFRSLVLPLQPVVGRSS